MFNAQNRHGNAHGKLSQAPVENLDKDPPILRGIATEGGAFSPRLRWRPSASTHPGYRIAINKLDPEGLAMALSPSASTAPQIHKPSSLAIFPIQAVLNCFKPFQGFFRKKRLFKFFANSTHRPSGGHDAVIFSRPFTAIHALSRLFYPPPGEGPYGRYLWGLCASVVKNGRKSGESNRIPTSADQKICPAYALIQVENLLRPLFAITLNLKVAAQNWKLPFHD